jgi:hypothetical protein
VLRTLSLQNPDVLIVSGIALEAFDFGTSPQSAADRKHQPPASTSSLTQLDEIKRMVESMAAEPPAADGAADPKRALMAAIARSALSAPPPQPPLSILSSSFTVGNAPPGAAPVDQHSCKLESLMESMLGKLTSQQAAIEALAEEMAALRQECREAKALVQDLVELQTVQHEHAGHDITR